MPSARRASVLIALAVLAGCSRHRSREVTAVAGFTADTPVFLDAPVQVRFGTAIDPATVTAQSVGLVASAGPGLAAPVVGTWRVRGDTIEFLPELAHDEPIATRGGLQPATRYELWVRGDGLADAVRTRDGRPVPSTAFAFTTRAGEHPAQLFHGNRVGGPRLTAVDAAPRDAAGDWQLGRTFRPSTLQLQFDQALHPAALAAAPFALRWNDAVWGADAGLDVAVELVSNTAEGALVQLRPRGVLPSRAVVELVVAPTLRDLWGDDNVGSFVEPVRPFRTEADETPRADALVFDFADATPLGDTDFAEVPAVVADGALRVPDTFPSVDADVGDWAPLGSEVTLDTDVQTLVYQNGIAKTLAGGMLPMRNLHIPVGCVVRGSGSHPLVFVVDGDARIEGILSADGADARALDHGGQYRGPGDVHPAGSSGATAVVGASGGPAGGAGGTAGVMMPVVPAAPGIAAAGVIDGGGGGGTATYGATQASAGGGGGGAVSGDPWFPAVIGANGFPQRGGVGAATVAGPGGVAGRPWFTNADSRDDFSGRAFVPHLGRTIVGELNALRGGSGGGSGGGWSSTPQPLPATFPGGGGGGGGGVLVLQVRGKLTIAATGRITANGGDGVSGSGFVLPGGFPNRGSGGGGGGGAVVLMAGGGIELHVRGETFANRDYDFSIAADGGICVTPTTDTGPAVNSKYPANGAPVVSAETYTTNPLGGFGGMGLVQLMVPVGRDNLDGTNTVLDDAITLVRDGVPLVGADKQRFLGWRGFPDANGVFVDDAGQPTNTIGGQGDIRPDPVLLPVPWATNGTARARSAWLPLGARHRRALAAPDGLPRGVVGAGLTFATHARADGWLPYGDGKLSPSTSGVERLKTLATVLRTATDTATLGVPSLAIELAADLPEAAPGSYTGCIADFAPTVGGTWAQRRVLHSTSRTLFVDGAMALPDGADRVQLLGWFADLGTPAPGSYLGADATAVPRANVRIGFAFHRDPAHAAAQGVDADRYPAQVGTFLHDLSEPATIAALRAFGPRTVQWDVLLDGAWRSTPYDQPPPAGPGSAIALRRFFLPLLW